MGKNLGYIGPWAFWGCASLSSVTLPKSVNWIGGFAFLYCTSLTSVYFKGNAPPDTKAFDYADNAFIYYLPGTTGWSMTYGGRPTRLWQPELRPDVQTNHFGFDISWTEGMTVVVEATTNLASPSWLPVQTNTLTADVIYFNDAEWINYPNRFYRTRWP